jgi:hypothetical protein
MTMRIRTGSSVRQWCPLRLQAHMRMVASRAINPHRQWHYVSTCGVCVAPEDGDAACHRWHAAPLPMQAAAAHRCAHALRCDTRHGARCVSCSQRRLCKHTEQQPFVVPTEGCHTAAVRCACTRAAASGTHSVQRRAVACSQCACSGSCAHGPAAETAAPPLRASCRQLAPWARGTRRAVCPRTGRDCMHVHGSSVRVCPWKGRRTAAVNVRAAAACARTHSAPRAAGGPRARACMHARSRVPPAHTMAQRRQAGRRKLTDDCDRGKRREGGQRGGVGCARLDDVVVGHDVPFTVPYDATPAAMPTPRAARMSQKREQA